MVAADAALFEEVATTIEAARTQVNRLAAAVDTAGGALPSAVRAQWEDAIRMWNELDEIVEQVRTAPGAPEALRTYATGWDRDVGGAASAIAGRADPAYTKIQDYWEGEAVEAYLAMLPGQRRALEEIKENFTDPISTAHEQLATKIHSFWYSGVLVGYAGVALVIAVCTGVTVYFGPGALPSVILALVAAVAAASERITSKYEELRSEAAHQRSVLHQRLTDLAAYPDGHWPRPTVSA